MAAVAEFGTMIVAAAQMGPVQPEDSRADVVERLMQLVSDAAKRGVRLVAFPEAVLTAFFPHWYIEDDAELDTYFEQEMPSPVVAPLFELGRQLEVGFSLGYAELVRDAGEVHRFNTSVLVSPRGEILGKYRKIHLPGFEDRQDGHPFDNLEKRYFEVGNLGLPTWNFDDATVGMCICNDRRWPEVYRMLGLQGAEIVLVSYNTPRHNPALPESDRLADFHNHLSMQAGAYQNGTWVIGAAKAGVEAGVSQIGGSCIIAPSGEIVALSSTDGDELVVAQVDLDQAKRYQQHVWNMDVNRHPELYGALVDPGASAGR